MSTPFDTPIPEAMLAEVAEVPSAQRNSFAQMGQRLMRGVGQKALEAGVRHVVGQASPENPGEYWDFQAIVEALHGTGLPNAAVAMAARNFVRNAVHEVPGASARFHGDVMHFEADTAELANQLAYAGLNQLSEHVTGVSYSGSPFADEAVEVTIATREILEAAARGQEEAIQMMRVVQSMTPEGQQDLNAILAIVDLPETLAKRFDAIGVDEAGTMIRHIEAAIQAEVQEHGLRSTAQLAEVAIKDLVPLIAAGELVRDEETQNLIIRLDPEAFRTQFATRAQEIAAAMGQSLGHAGSFSVDDDGLMKADINTRLVAEQVAELMDRVQRDPISGPEFLAHLDQIVYQLDIDPKAKARVEARDVEGAAILHDVGSAFSGAGVTMVQQAARQISELPEGSEWKEMFDVAAIGLHQFSGILMTIPGLVGDRDLNNLDFVGITGAVDKTSLLGDALAVIAGGSALIPAALMENGRVQKVGYDSPEVMVIMAEMENAGPSPYAGAEVVEASGDAAARIEDQAKNAKWN